LPKRAALDLAAMLSGGDRRSIGRSDEAAALAIADLATRLELVRLLDSTDPLVRMRAADALEKVSREAPELLRVFRALFLRMAGPERQPEVRWHLAQIIPRLSLNADERARAVEALRHYLEEDGSAIVQTWALNAIVEIAREDERFGTLAESLLQEGLESRHASVRSRSRALLLERERGPKSGDA